MTCKHLKTRIDGREPVGRCTCPECGEGLPIYVPINNMLDAMQEMLDKDIPIRPDVPVEKIR